MTQHNLNSYSQGRIFAVRNDRLGGRLGAMLNARRIADDYGFGFGFTWASHENVSPELQHPETLFTENFLERYRETKLTFGDLQQNALPVESLPYEANKEWFFQQMAHSNMMCTESLRVITLPWEDPNIIAERVAQTLNSFEFTEPVQRAMKDIRSRLGDVTLVAYHLRRGDIIDPEARPSNVLWPSKYIPRVYYEEHISRVLSDDPTARIVIFSDTEHEVDAFCKISDRVIPASTFIEVNNLEPLQRDFLELFTMSICKRIVAPGASAFSSVAAILGNSKIVPIITDLTPEERESALNRLTDQLNNSPELFAGDADLGQNFPELIAFHHRTGTPDVARSILKKHHLRGFKYSYIHDLLAEQNFHAGDCNAALEVVNTLRQRPILTDLGNAQTYAWAGLTALSAGRMNDAARLAHISRWLQPNLPISQILMGMLVHTGLPDDNQYPFPKEMVVVKKALVDRFRLIASKLRVVGFSKENSELLAHIPFELDIRDWQEIQSLRLPAPFWNIPKQKKLLSFFESLYRQNLEAPCVMSLRGQVYRQVEEFETGNYLINLAYNNAPEDPIINIRRARMQWAEANYDDALTSFQNASNLSGGQVCFNAEYGKALIQLGEKNKAIDIFAELAKRTHDIIEVHILTADALRRKKSTRELALEVATRADNMVPGGLRTSQVHRKILQQLDREEEANKISNTFLKWKRNPGKFSSRIKLVDRN